MSETLLETTDVRGAVVLAMEGFWHPDAAGDFDRWLAAHDEGQRIKGIQGLLDYRPLPRDVRRYIEYYLEAAAEESGRKCESSGSDD